MKKWILAGTALTTALALAACGGDAGSSGERGAPTLSMVDNAFQPTTLGVTSGDTVEVSNDGEAPHNITIEGQGIDKDVEPGQSTSVTFDLDAGEYTMFCEYHRGAGMEGTLTVS